MRGGGFDGKSRNNALSNKGLSESNKVMDFIEYGRDSNKDGGESILLTFGFYFMQLWNWKVAERSDTNLIY